MEAYEYILPLFCMLAGTYIILLLARLVTVYGIGNGISLFIGFAIIRVLYGKIGDIFGFQRETGHDIDIRPFIILAVAALVVVLVEKLAIKLPVKFKGVDGGYLPLKLTAAGLIPVTVSTGLTGTLSTLQGAMLSAYVQYGLGVAACVLSSIIFAKAFHSHGEMVKRLIGAGAQVSSDIMAQIKRKVMLIIIPASSLYLIAVVVMSLSGYYPREINLLLSGSLTVTLVVILMDIWNEAKLRMMAEPVVIHVTHDVDEAGVIKSMLEAHGVACRMKGYYHRAILYFFGPHVEISVMVPRDRADEAVRIISEFVEQPRQPSEELAGA